MSCQMTDVKILTFWVVMSGLTAVACETETERVDENGKKDTSAVLEADTPEAISESAIGKKLSIRNDSVNNISLMLEGFNTEGIIGPRVAEIRLRLSSNLDFQGATKGPALDKAQKDLVEQEMEGDVLRLVILSMNINEIRSGKLAQLTFVKTDDQPAKVEILTDKPIFAPAEVNEGLMVGDPLIF